MRVPYQGAIGFLRDENESSTILALHSDPWVLEVPIFCNIGSQLKLLKLTQFRRAPYPSVDVYMYMYM